MDVPPTPPPMMTARACSIVPRLLVDGFRVLRQPSGWQAVQAAGHAVRSSLGLGCRRDERRPRPDHLARRPGGPARDAAHTDPGRAAGAAADRPWATGVAGCHRVRCDPADPDRVDHRPGQPPCRARGPGLTADCGGRGVPAAAVVDAAVAGPVWRGGSPVASADLPPLADAPVLVGAGDIGDCGSDGDEATAALLDDIPGTVFTAGDNAYDDGAARDFEQCYAPSWGRHLARTWPTPGNHDWHTGGLAGYRDYFGTAGAGPDGASWYARDLGTWRVIVLDSNCEEVGGCAADSAQGRWLAAELEASDAACTVSIFHHPRFSSGERYGDDPAMDPFWRALYAGGVDVVVNGHEHSYERFAPQDPDAREDRARGIREFVVGTGGAGLRGFGTTSANSELRASVAHGVLALTLGDGSYDWEFHAAGSDFSDRGTASCH